MKFQAARRVWLYDGPYHQTIRAALLLGFSVGAIFGIALGIAAGFGMAAW